MHPSADSIFSFLNREPQNSTSLLLFIPFRNFLTKGHSGPAAIVYNERGHRAEEDEPDTYPEDDLSSQNTPRSERLRSEPSSRARTPTDSYNSERENSIRRGRETPVSVVSSAIPEIVRVERSLSSKGPSAVSSPSVHSRAAAHSVRSSDGDRTGSESDRKRLDKGKERERDRDYDRERERVDVFRSGPNEERDT